MKKTISLTLALLGAPFSQADLLASWDTFTENGASTTGGLSVEIDKFGKLVPPLKTEPLSCLTLLKGHGLIFLPWTSPCPGPPIPL